MASAASEDILRADIFMNLDSVAKIFHIYERKIRAKYNKTNVIVHITLFYWFKLGIWLSFSHDWSKGWSVFPLIVDSSA